ncbi:tRNAse Z TRZ4, mitochondrial isoform X2 [Nicotiana tomentosiformis]|uniref:tRNAse Z TRZ4, mitochondrial isoform X2 n=1 Tax=Nicotiana tomentosiformis TaxID=4098 RepID=UPI0014462E31|nr:tRNAse Z TRZ4, mitochondrial isoform X2 [Nicotiana tomentosiformis]
MGKKKNKRRAEGNDNNDRPKKNPKPKDQNKSSGGNGKAYVQILGNGMDTQDTSPSVLLFFDNRRFLFNVGEIDDILLSRVCSETAGGLPGLLLTLAGMGKERMSVNVWGPPDLDQLVEAMKSFVPNAAMVHTHSVLSTHGSNEVASADSMKFDHLYVPIVDEVVKICAIPLRPRCSKVCDPMKEGSSKLNAPLVDDYHFAEDLQAQMKNSTAEDALDPGDISVVYICEFPEIKGKLDRDKAAELGLESGPKYGELKRGNPVKSDHLDRTIHPCDVMEPSFPGPIVLLVDCPTLSHLQELSSLQSLTLYYSNTSEQPVEMCKKVNCLIHLSPASVTNTTAYEQWMTRFGEAQHIMAGHEPKNIEIPILKSSSRIAAKLNYLCPQFFPAPGFLTLKQLKSLPSVSRFPRELSLPTSCRFIYAENLLKFNLLPYKDLGLDNSGVADTFSRTEIIDELTSEIPEIVSASEHIIQLWHGNNGTNGGTPLPSCLEGITREDMEIVLLGTGSSQPSKYRNVSSIFINLFSKGGILLDCGEGTLGQLKRRFGVEGADEAVKGLRCIWISHIHADHHAGLARILTLRRDLLNETPHEPLIVVGPQQLEIFLDRYQMLEDLDMQFLDSRDTTKSSWEAFESNEDNDANGSASRLKNTLRESGLISLNSVPVIHCPQAYGIVLKAADKTNVIGKMIPGWKIVYSGDTRPCPELVEASRGATVFIHEATFEDGMVEEAIAKNHSTMGEAVDAGDAAGAYRVILTHFSQRYPKIPVFDESYMNKACVAFDLMSVNLADLPMLPRVLPYLKLLFRDEIVVHESDDVNSAIAEV